MAEEEITLESALDVVSFLEQHNGKLIVNINTSAVGHTLAEFDNYARMRLTGELDPNGIHMYMAADDERSSTVLDLYGNSLMPATYLSEFAPEMVRSIALFRPDLTVDVGISSFKVGPIEGKTNFSEGVPGGFRVYRTGLKCLLDDTTAYYRRQLETYDQAPMCRQFPITDELENFIGAKGRPLALIQIKEEESTGSPEASDPQTYVPTLEYLKDAGYHLVQVGREHYPKIFSRLGVVDYANSPLASFANDFFLFSNASFCLLGPSGVWYFAEIMKKPLVITNSWWTAVPPFSPQAVVVPALAKSRSDNELMKFIDQLLLFARIGVHFPMQDYEVVRPDGDDILAATRECLELDKELVLLNDDQQHYKKLATGIPNSVALSRLSAAFLERYRDLL